MKKLIATLVMTLPMIAFATNLTPANGVFACQNILAMSVFIEATKTNNMEMARPLWENEMCFKLRGGLPYNWVVRDALKFEDMGATAGQIQVTTFDGERFKLIVIQEMMNE